MALVEVNKLILPAVDENGDLKYLIGIKIGNKDPAIINHHGKPLVFDNKKDAQSYIDDDSN